MPKCSIMSGCGTRIVHREQKPLARPCFGSLFPPLAALTFAASSIICAFAEIPGHIVGVLRPAAVKPAAMDIEQHFLAVGAGFAIPVAIRRFLFHGVFRQRQFRTVFPALVSYSLVIPGNIVKVVRL